MRLVSTKEFHDQVNRMLRSKEALAVTMHGQVAGFYIPSRQSVLPPDVRWKIIQGATARIAKELKKQGITEKEILADFKRWRQARRTPRR